MVEEALRVAVPLEMQPKPVDMHGSGRDGQNNKRTSVQT